MTSTPPRWPTSWPSAATICDATPLGVPVPDITAAGEILAGADIDPDWVQFMQMVAISVLTAPEIARRLVATERDGSADYADGL